MGESHRINVIGGGAAGISAGSMAKRTNPDATVVVCTEFEDVAYSPCGIPYVLGREIPDFERLFLAGPENYAEAGIDLRRETVVTDVDVAARTMTANGEVLPWDRLIVCTGWNYLLPDVPGNDLEGITFVKNIRRGIELNEQLNDVKKAVVLEAGPLGVEMLTALVHRGIETHLVDENAWLLAQVADPDIAEPVQTSLEELGCKLHFGVGLTGFAGSGGRVTGVETTEGLIDCDMVIVATHKEPDTALARAMGLPLGSTGAVVVDERMQTPMRDVYAAGDVVEVPQNLTGIAVQGLTGSHAMQQGRVAGANAGGGDPHQRHGDEESVFAPQPVAEEAEQDRAERAEAETDRETGPDQQDFQRLVIAREKGCADQRGERAVDEEIIPFEDRPRAARGNDQADFLFGRLPVRCDGTLGHVALPPSRLFLA